MNKDWKRNITFFITCQTISLFGTSLVQYAIMWHITLTTQSGVMMTLAIICGFLPTFFLSPFAGVWADRYNRKILIVLSDSAIALATLVLAILFLLGHYALVVAIYYFCRSCTRDSYSNTNDWSSLTTACSWGSSELHSPCSTHLLQFLLQEKVSADYLGRVFGVLGMVSSSMMPLGMLIFGPLSDIIRIELLLRFTGVLMLFQALFLAGDKSLIKAVNSIKV